MATRCFRAARWLGLLWLLALTGCSGCRQDGEKLSREELEKRAKEKRESLQMSELLSLPTDSETRVLTAKPGHWYETQQQFKSNREDLQVVAGGSVARGNKTTRVPGTNMTNQFMRRTSLPKGQTKTVDLQYFVPATATRQTEDDMFSVESQQLQFRTELFSWPLMTPILQAPNTKPANELKPNEYQLVVMGPESLSYAYLTALDAVFWRGDELMLEERIRSYFVSIVKPVDNRYALPRSLLTMTATAVIVWDDVAPQDLSLDQQAALIDWLHWGGQLIVSGPGSWSRLQGSFLSPYLPATSAETTELTSEDFQVISDKWVVPDRSRPNELDPLQIVGPPAAGLRFQLSPRGQWLPHSGELVAESQVGRGRVVVTGFPLRDQRIYRWKYFSSFFSSGLLRRPARTVQISAGEGLLSQRWAAPFTGAETDPRLHSNLRILTRDLPLSSSVVQAIGSDNLDQIGKRSAPLVGGGNDLDEVALNAPPVENTAQIEAVRWGSDGAAWNDYSGLSYQALAALKSAAGIELPSRKTIVYLLAGYLACLVPLNWLVFKLLGRLEYAWIAAPLMALVGVVVVTRVARLDIGFARRTTEIALLELHEDHPRGHLTQYIALYTSLSTNYSVEFPENGSVALPLGDVARANLRAGGEERLLRTNYGRSEGVVLEPLTVYSNSTEMLHAEQMVDVGGGLVLGQRESGPAALKNETNLELRSGLVLRRTQAGAIESAWVGDLNPGQAVTLAYEPVAGGKLFDKWSQELATRQERPSEEELLQVEDDELSLWIGGVLHEAARKTPLMPGQTRLIAYTVNRPGDLRVVPAEDQFDGTCVLVAHLTPQVLGELTPDRVIMSRLATPLEPAGPATESDGEMGTESAAGAPNDPAYGGGAGLGGDASKSDPPYGTNAEIESSEETLPDDATKSEGDGGDATEVEPYGGDGPEP